MATETTDLITVELTSHEARAVKNFIGLMGDTITCLQRVGVSLPAGHTMPPLISAQLKCELALALAGEQQ